MRGGYDRVCAHGHKEGCDSEVHALDEISRYKIRAQNSAKNVGQLLYSELRVPTYSATAPITV